MNIKEINIRDPYILPHDGKYYLYGTRSATTWGPADGFDCYVSEDLNEWEGPIEIFHRPEGFFADREYWAPECVFYQGAFYLITTFGAEHTKKGVYVLRSDSPTGPFAVYSERLTPKNWVCIDGSIYFEDAHTPVLFFSHSFEDSPTGDMCMIYLQEDLKAAKGEPIKLFEAADASWAKPVPFAKAEFGMDGDVYFTDGPGVIKMEDGKLYMTWSSWSVAAYAVGVAVSDSGSVRGPWRQVEQPLYPENGGHGMVFRDFEGTLRFTLHSPNTKFEERPVIYDLKQENETLVLV
jgi:GH43 family beta-xylosidase